jgi:hypothetical protein
MRKFVTEAPTKKKTMPLMQKLATSQKRKNDCRQGQHKAVEEPI